MAGTTVKIDLLGEGNYNTWKLRVKALLQRAGLWAAVSGTPANSKQDEKAMSEIILTVQDTLLPLIGDLTTAKEMWDTLEQLYKSKSKARVKELQRQLNNLSKSKVESLTEYVNRGRAIYIDLVAAGGSVTESEVVSYVLRWKDYLRSTCNKRTFWRRPMKNWT